MLQIESCIQHSLGQVVALEKMQGLVMSLSEIFPQQVHQVRLQLSQHRIDVSFVAYGYLVHWQAEVYDDQVQLVGQIPESASQFRGKMLRAISERVEDCLASPLLAKAA